MAMDSNDTALEGILLKVATGDSAALTSLLEDATAAELIEEVSKRAASKYKHDRADIRQVLALQILTSINTLADANKLYGWLYVTAKNYCLNAIKHQNEETRALKNNPLLPSQPPTPEQQLIDKEQEESQEARLQRLRMVTRSFPPEIVSRWARGESPRKIAQETGKPIATIYRLLTAMQRTVTHELTIEQPDASVQHEHGGRVRHSRTYRDPSTEVREARRARKDVMDQRTQAQRTSSSSTEQILSAMEQLDAAELEKLVPRAIALGAARRAPHVKPEESKLLALANEAVPPELRSRLSKLQKKRDARSLSDAEIEELIALSDRVEQLHAERLEALADLARLRGTTLTELMDQLGIRFPDNA
jgi:DNA-directed RNA polymerase specialized sigma24 family protein